MNDNFDFWKMAFDKKIADIPTLINMVRAEELTLDQFQKITGLDYIPVGNSSNNNFISTKSIVQNLAKSRIANMKKDVEIKTLEGQVAQNKISSMKKDLTIKSLMSQIANNKIQIMKMKVGK